VTYDDYSADDRNTLVAGSFGNLFFNNYVNGIPTNIFYDSVQVAILDENDTVLTSSSSIVMNDTGLYSVNITIPISAYGEQHDYRDR
jgi:hypothetical protein